MGTETEAERHRLVDRLREQGDVRSSPVDDAMRTVPRAEFVRPADRPRAYEDVPLDIGSGQVVTAPHLVADMTELLEPSPGDAVLEIGTGSGYHAAVLAELVGDETVYSVERRPELADWARENLERAGYPEVTVVVGDGTRGLPAHAPYDRISVAAAGPEIPPPLLEQLRDGGRMVVPLGTAADRQTLYLLEKTNGEISRTAHRGVRFVPLVGEHGLEDGDDG